MVWWCMAGIYYCGIQIPVSNDCLDACTQCLQLSCPLSLEALCQLLPLQLQLIVQAQGEFSSCLDTLKLLAQQYSL